MRYREQVEQMNEEYSEKVTKALHKLSRNPNIGSEDRITLEKAIALIEEGQAWRKAYIKTKELITG